MSILVLPNREDQSFKKSIDYHKELNQEQLEVVLNADGPCLVLAGAGSGKTRTITYRVAYLLEKGVDPSRILLLTFTNKASKEMLNRVSGLLGDAAKGIWGGTFHSIANRLLRSTAEQMGYSNKFTILDTGDSESLIKAVMKDLKIDPKARRFPTAAVVHNILSFATNTRTDVVDVLDLKHPNFISFADEIEEIGRQYTDRKKAANSMDFDDLLLNLNRVLANIEWRERISMQFEFVLVDEYQDTNALQASIVQGLSSHHKNVLVVGDDAQSIYAFRGADVKNILRFPDTWPNTKIFKLVTNYRSTPEILELANTSLSNNVNRFEKELIGIRPKGGKPVVVPAASASQEARFVVEKVLEQRAEGVALGNMAVLFRSSSHSQMLEFELMKRDVPYEYRGGAKFFERAHIKDVLSYLRVFDNTRDEAGWIRVLNLQTGIGAVTAMRLISQIKQYSDLHQVIGANLDAYLPGKAKNGWVDFMTIIESMMGHGPMPSHMLRAIINSGYRDYAEREFTDWRERLEDLEQLAIFAENYRDASSLMADIALYDEVIRGRDKNSAAQTERLILSTVHQAKGLEWDTVFVIHLADTFFPNRRAMTEEGGVEEERRLFYVAVTRAKRKLFLTYPVTSGMDTIVLNQPSLFIEEIPPNLTERLELRDAERRISPSGYGRSGASHTDGVRRDEWNWDSSYEEPAIEIDRRGDRVSATPSVWKSKPKTNTLPSVSYLSDINDL
ncbi:MAG: UvrD-helicase domain-containing protein [Patescibacteria group bacterium]